MRYILIISLFSLFISCQSQITDTANSASDSTQVIDDTSFLEMLTDRNWVYQNAQCQDMLMFSYDGSYRFLSDCHGPGRNEPLSESGDFEIDAQRGDLILKNRMLTNKYDFFSPERTLRMKIISASPAQIEFRVRGRRMIITGM